VAERVSRGYLLQFAKAPVPGRVKSRLQPALGAEGAAAVARELTAFVAASLDTLPAGWEAILCADSPEDEALCAIARRHQRPVWSQGDGDLGERMGRCIERALQSAAGAIVVGSDCTGYDRAYLQRAITILESGADAVLGPAVDGGYVLIGVRRWVPGLMDGIAWGGAGVAEAQRRRLADAGYRWGELAPRADIDRPEDLWMMSGVRIKP
jgi:hypothetical protein